MRRFETTEEPLVQITLANHPELQELLPLTVRQRVEVILHVGLDRTVTPEDQLMILGALSLLKSGNPCSVPEHVIELLTWCVLTIRWLQETREGE